MSSPDRYADQTLSLARLIAVLVPNLLLWGAIASQYIGGLYPCEMCMWQRWTHITAIFLALAAIVQRRSSCISALATGFSGLAIAASGAIGLFHAGVEYKWWKGFSACTTTVSGATAQDVLDSIMAAPLTRCDTAPWSLFGVSLAGYNAAFSLLSALVVGGLLLRWYTTAGKAGT